MFVLRVKQFLISIWKSFFYFFLKRQNTIVKNTHTNYQSKIFDKSSLAFKNENKISDKVSFKGRKINIGIITMHRQINTWLKQPFVKFEISKYNEKQYIFDTMTVRYPLILCILFKLFQILKKISSFNFIHNGG